MVKAGRSLKPKRKPNRDIARIKIFIPLIFVLIVTILTFGGNNDNNNETTYKVIKVLVYSGTDTDANSIYQIERSLDQSNSQHMIPGVKFVYNISNVIDDQTLSGYDVLIMPGGTSGYDYLQSGNISSTAIKNFVSSGKGYLGICAGAYSAAQYTNGWYYGWGLAPDVVNEPYLETGNVTISTTSAGTEILGRTDRMISHINGPAMYISGGNAVTFATYTYSNSSYGGYAAIVGDRYGNGRTVLSGVHPELTPQDPELLVKLIIWAYNGTYVNDTSV